MSLRTATSLCVVSLVLSLVGIAVGVAPYASGLHDVSLTSIQLGPEGGESVKNQAGGQTMLSFAASSVALANRNAEAYNSLAQVSRLQSFFLIGIGGAVALSNVLLLYWLRLRRGVSNEGDGNAT